MSKVRKIGYRIIVLAISFCFIFEQAGFAQIAPQLGIPAYLNGQISADIFRPMQLRSLSYDSLTNNFSLFLDKGDSKNPAQNEIQQNSRKLMEYFRVGIVLPNSKFWVNLRPDKADEVIDPDLEKTDLGKVLMEADLQLKKDMANFTSPNTLEGRQYWNKLYEKAQTLFGLQEISIPTLTRPWIVPNEVIIRKTQDSAYIYKATLKVMLEQDYLKDSPQYNFDDPRLKELNSYSSQLVRELIIPKLTREVNSSKRYSALRQVYYSLTLAQWFKQNFKNKRGAFASFIDSNDLSGLSSKNPWNKDTYFQAYKRSFAKGEYDQQENVTGLSGMTIRRYFSGGILPLVEAKTVQEGIDGRIGVPQKGLLEIELPADNLDGAVSVRSSGTQEDLTAGKKDGGLESVQFLLNLKDGKDYPELKNIYKKLLSFNQVKAIYDLEDTINKWEKAEKKDLKEKYQALKREAVWENIEADKNNALSGLIDALKEKEKAGQLSNTEARDTLVRVNDWLIRPGYQGYLVSKLKSMISARSWQAVIQSFYMIIDFGTAGKRGQQVEKDRASADVLPGPNIINDYTVAEYAYAQARYLLATGQAERGVVLGGDTRIKSSLPRVHKGQTEQAYTDLQSEILRKMGVKVYRFPEPRSIAEAAWATVMLDAASMAYNSASHNLWHDNGVKASNEFSSQLFAKEKDAYKGYIEEVLPEDIAALEQAPFKAEEITLNVDKVMIDGAEVVDVDGEYIKAVRSFVTDNNIIRENSDKVKSFYSPVQGSGVYTIPRMLNDGQDFKFDVTVSRLQRYQDTEGQFISTDKPDPAYEDEITKKRTINVAIREAEAIENGKRAAGETDYKFDFVCATDPDSDRSVFAVRDNQGNWKMLKANDVWGLLGWYMLKQRKAQGRLPEYAIKTWVTTDLVKEIVEDPEFGLKVIEPAVGFNKIAEVALKEIAIPGLLGKAQSQDFMRKVEALEKEGKPLTLDLIAREINKTRRQAMEEINSILRQKLLFGVEESNGFSPGGHTLEKDAAVAVMIFHEVAAYAKYLNELINFERINELNDKKLIADLKSFVENNPGQELTVYNLLNMLFLRYGYFPTENKPLTFDDSPQGRQAKERVLAHLKSLLGHAEAVKFKDRQATRIKTGNQYMNGYEDNGIDVPGHGTTLVFNEPGYRFELDQAGTDYITFRPSGTEPYIRTYGQLRVAPDQLTWKDIEQEKAEADKEITAIVLAAQEEERGIDGLAVERPEVKIEKLPKDPGEEVNRKADLQQLVNQGKAFNLIEAVKSGADRDKAINAINGLKIDGRQMKAENFETAPVDIISERAVEKGSFTYQAVKPVANGETVVHFNFGGAASRLGLGGMYFVKVKELAKVILGIESSYYGEAKAEEIKNKVGEYFVQNEGKAGFTSEKFMADVEKAYKELGEAEDIGMGPAQIVSYRQALKKFALQFGLDEKEVIARNSVIIHVNDEILEDVANDLSRNDFYGFKPENVLLLSDTVFHGYKLNSDYTLEYDEQSNVLPPGHGYALEQFNRKNQVYIYQGKTLKQIEDPLLKILKEKGVKIIRTQRVNDVSLWAEDVLSLQRLGYFIEEAANGAQIGIELVGNPTGQKGGSFLRIKGSNWGFLVETLALKTPELEALIDKAGKEKLPYNAFRNIYTIEGLESILKNNLPRYLKFDKGEFYTETVTGDVTQLVNSKTVAFRISKKEEIHDFKEFKNLPEALEFLKKWQDYVPAVPAKDGGSKETKAQDPLGGVDFRAIPVGGQMINPIPLTPRVMEMVNSASMKDLNEEWQDIQGRTLIGPVPYDQLKEYVAACCQRPDTSRQIEEIQTWVNNVLSLEEAAAVPTSRELKEVLLALG